mmetsp:Transcript_66440/g.117481  ORF Transcript_66440/g.117481 Transcript_66440/m.117481 type:complete len:328 (+) Transcript_66440:52-1035(+)
MHAVLAFVLLVWPVRAKLGTEEALLRDDECSSDGSCAVNALQLQGALQSESHVEKEGSYIDAEAAEVSETTWPSCYKYGCFARYSRYSICQCNPHCHQQRNCCPDYYRKCWHKDKEPQHHAAAQPNAIAPVHPPAAGSSAKCSAVPGCAKLNLGSGDCCPTPAGMYLGCCPESMQPHPTAPPPSVINGRNIMTLYHQTSPQICQLILAGGFKIGHGGWCGNAIYFAVTPQATKTKAITPHSGTGCMIEAKVDVGNIQKFPCCRYCGGQQNQHVYWTEDSLTQKGYQSIEINPGDGPEVIVYNPKQVLSTRIIPWNPAWLPHKMHYKE